MRKLILSPKGKKLINFYNQMVENNYENNLFNLKIYKEYIKDQINNFEIESVLDYGCGRVDWDSKNFDASKNISAKEYFNIQDVSLYEPSINVDSRKKSDCVICFDVLEHIFVSDIKKILNDIFFYANKLVILQIACYPAKAKLPNGENAHILVRNPYWWKGIIDGISIDYEDVSVCLLCSTEYKKTIHFNIWSANQWTNQDGFVT
tara:strand:- start:340 stop:957 length:618 start_codon:yes stop_codon:yes gene_type:complete